MSRIVVDVENKFTVIEREGKTDRTDNMPFSGNNYLVSVGIRDIDTGDKWYYFFRHNDLEIAPDELRKRFDEVQAKLDSASLIVGHFLKHDIIWLRASGFNIRRTNFWDTAIPEYVMNRGQTHPLSLKELCIKYDLPRKKTDLTEGYLEQGVGFEAMPVDIVQEYGIGDIDSTAALFLHQQKQLQRPENIGLVPTVTMMNEFMYVLSKWQAAGIKIDKTALEQVREQYVAEQKQLIADLNTLARKVMGDTPFSLTSPVDKSVLIYSRRVKGRKEWVKRFNIGTDEKGKALKRPRFKDNEFVNAVRELTEVEYRTKAAQCDVCQGAGKVAKVLKNGTMGKPRFNCSKCGGCGIVYTKTGKVAGFKLKPINYKATTANGFDTDKATLELLAKTAEGDAKVFLEKIKRLNAVNTYISTFCDGILNNITRDHVLYTNFNQCITATGRLSSTDPNFQNQPRGKTFPVRRAIVSRFPGGKIIEGDFCVAPNTRILTEDLKWVEAGDVKIGDKLLGFNEQFNSMRDVRTEVGKVIKTKRLIKECVKIETSHGVIVCSIDHQWVARKKKKKARWYRAEELIVGDTISRYVEPWEVLDTQDAGWLAGFLDGEGYIHGTKVGFGQNHDGDNALCLNRAKEILKTNGFDDLRISPSKTSRVHRVLSAGEQQGLRIVGMFRPVRLLAKMRRNLEGRRTWGKRTAPATILKITPMGQQEVVAIQTTTKTFFAEGMLSHNCQLEFRVAGELSDDEQVLQDILNNVDAHAFTRDTLIAAGMQVDRQDAKPHTFKPLYGGEYGTQAEMAYYRAFKLKFKGVAEWQSNISEIVLRRKVLTLPSGREYCWPRAERRWDGKVDFFTQIVNYPVQGFATADIVPLACIRLDKAFEQRGLRSVPFLTVHDSIAVDVHPGEEQVAADLLADSMLEVRQEMKARYNYDFKMPLEVEVKGGINWLDTKVVSKKAHEYVERKDKSVPSNSDFTNDPLPDFMSVA